VIIPGLNSQYISLAKNSALAVAVGYADLYSVGLKTTSTRPAGHGGVPAACWGPTW